MTQTTAISMFLGHRLVILLGKAGYKSVSIGIAVFSADEDLTAEKIIEKADKALYRAKRNGRNQASA
ncbi:MAG: Diguanylate cyclase, domain [Clostridiales bacterium]|jgi:diguanylate cyclase (GGDEF)-like protein|nr:Diguanylate cyclase, domain [Clostridiales bacterium]